MRPGSLAVSYTHLDVYKRQGKRRAKHPFEDNPVIDGFLEWMEAPEGQQSIEALDLVFAALQHAGVDARQRKIVWPDGKRLSIEQSAERIHADHPGVACDLIETHVVGWLESCVPESYSCLLYTSNGGSQRSLRAYFPIGELLICRNFSRT